MVADPEVFERVKKKDATKGIIRKRQMLVELPLPGMVGAPAEVGALVIMITLAPVKPSNQLNRRPTTTSTPESAKVQRVAWPWEP